MVWDPSQPEDTTKIRNLGIVIRPNWQAIEQAEASFLPIAINLNNRNILPPNNDPTPIDDANNLRQPYIIYSKEDGNGNPELYGRDPSGVISQFSQRGRNLDQTGYCLLPPGFLFQWGRGFMAGDTSAVTVTFPQAFSGTAWVVTSTPYNNPITGTTPREWGVNNITDTDFVANAFNGDTPQGGVNFGWMAVGPV